jgi:folate receptor
MFSLAVAIASGRAVLAAPQPQAQPQARAAAAVAPNGASASSVALGATPAPTCNPSTGIDGLDVVGTPAPLPPRQPLCSSFEGAACCTSAMPVRLATRGVSSFYDGYSYSMCTAQGKPTVSDACKRFMDFQECSFACDPALNAYYYNYTQIPLCSNYCDDWFAACASSFTCVTDWLSGYSYTNGVYSCPDGAVCKNFSDVYGSGQGLCNSMWGSVYSYSTDFSTCNTLAFYGRNPNGAAAPTPSPTAAPTCKSGAGAGAAAGAAAAAAVVLAAAALAAH